MASQAKYDAAQAAAMAVVQKAIEANVPAIFQYEVKEYMPQITTVVNQAAQAAVDAADGVQ
jgi:hypothetical protein